MPTATVFFQSDDHSKALQNLTEELKIFLAGELSCNDIQLQPAEISIRLVQTIGSGMLADVEVEIAAHAFSERVQNQDAICLRVRQFLLERTKIDDIRVWLILAELGHSWA